jgi:hypothetical protein
MNTKFCLENLKERDHTGGLGVDGNGSYGSSVGDGVDWMHLAQDRGQ